MEETIEICVPHAAETDKDMNEGRARKMMTGFFQRLKSGRSKMLCQGREQKKI